MPTSSPVNPNISSGANQSYWTASLPPFETESISSSMDTDVLVIGAGISGLTTAYRLLETGRRVIVTEDGFIGSGESGRTTAQITPEVDDEYAHIESKFGAEKARLVAGSHTAARNYIQQVIEKEKIDCNYQLVNGYYFLHPSDTIQTLKNELKSAQKAGLEVSIVTKMPSIQTDAAALEFPGQAQFHIMKYLKGLAEAITRKGGKIFTKSRVTKVKEGSAEANGFTITAPHIVVATNSPFIDLVTMHSKQHPYRSYVIAGRISKTDIIPALWWDTGNKNSTWVTEPYHYVRTEILDEENYLLISGGEDHKTGQADKEDIPEQDRYALLEQWTRKHFPAMKEILYRWSGQVLEPIDSLAFIGRNPGDKNIYIITGDSGNGMTYGTIGALLVSDLINEKENEWESLYDPSRLMFRAPLDFAQEALNMAAQYGDFFSGGDKDTVASLNYGEGAILGSGLKKSAVYRNEDGKLFAFSAVCPHLGCILQWNASEKSFDCPCHGSRFTCEGKLTNGPAINDLKPLDQSSLK